MAETPAPTTLEHPVVTAHKAKRMDSLQIKLADAITDFAGSMKFVYLHVLIFAIWCGTGLLGLDPYPFNFLTMTVSLEAIFLSTFVMIGQNRQAAFQQAKADHDFQQSELELKTNTDLTREIHTLTQELHRRVCLEEKALSVLEEAIPAQPADEPVLAPAPLAKPASEV